MIRTTHSLVHPLTGLRRNVVTDEDDCSKAVTMEYAKAGIRATNLNRREHFRGTKKHGEVVKATRLSSTADSIHSRLHQRKLEKNHIPTTVSNRITFGLKLTNKVI